MNITWSRDVDGGFGTHNHHRARWYHHRARLCGWRPSHDQVTKYGSRNNATVPPNPIFERDTMRQENAELNEKRNAALDEADRLRQENAQLRQAARDLHSKVQEFRHELEAFDQQLGDWIG